MMALSLMAIGSTADNSQSTWRFRAMAMLIVGIQSVLLHADGFSVGCWFSPSSLDAAVRNLIHKDGQFGLKHVGTNGVLRFTFTDANRDVQTFDSNAGAVRVGARLFAMVTHDVATSTLKMYLNGHLHKTFSQAGHVHASTNKVYLGISFEGVIAHNMLWTRSLSDQEVLELYFFPLNRVVQSRESE